jgi:hypothetical protein
MRLSAVLAAILFIVFENQATATVSGFAVAARWNGGYDFSWGNDWQYTANCKIMKYAITNGATSQTSVLIRDLRIMRLLTRMDSV